MRKFNVYQYIFGWHIDSIDKCIYTLHRVYWTNNHNFMSYDLNTRAIKEHNYAATHQFNDITIFRVIT